MTLNPAGLEIGALQFYNLSSHYETWFQAYEIYVGLWMSLCVLTWLQAYIRIVLIFTHVWTTVSIFLMKMIQ